MWCLPHAESCLHKKQNSFEQAGQTTFGVSESQTIGWPHSLLIHHLVCEKEKEKENKKEKERKKRRGKRVRGEEEKRREKRRRRRGEEKR